MHKALIAITLAGFFVTQTAHAAEINSFTASVATSGAFSATVQFDAADPDCTIVLRGSSSAEDPGSGLAITSFSVLSGVMSFQRSLKRKGTRKGYITAQLVCTDGITYSETIALKIKSIESSKSTISPTKWFEKLSHKFD